MVFFFNSPEWKYLHNWTKGTILGGLLGIFLLILSTFYVINTSQPDYALYFPILFFIISVAVGTLIGYYYKRNLMK